MTQKTKKLSARLQELDIRKIVTSDLDAALAFLHVIKEDPVVMDYLINYYQDKRDAEIKKALEQEKQLALEEIQNAEK